MQFRFSRGPLRDVFVSFAAHFEVGVVCSSTGSRVWTCKLPVPLDGVLLALLGSVGLGLSGVG